MKRLLLIGICLYLTFVGRSFAVPLWEIDGTRNHVYLLGSVHFLRAEDYPLPDAITTVFAAADIIVFELNLGRMDPLAAQTTMLQLAVDPRGKDLEDHLGARNYRSATTMAADINIDLATLRPYEPWFAALQITQTRLAQLGFNGAFGIETRLTIEAAADAKEIRGLESLEEQLGALDSLPAAAQREFLMQTLEDAAEIEAGLARIIAAWRAGDTKTLEEELMQDLAGQDALYDHILVRRNRNWTNQIIGFTRDRKNYLVVVGALHLVGDDSVIRMLEDAGYSTRRIE